MKKFLILCFFVLQISITAVAQNAALSYYNSVNQISKPILKGTSSFTMEFWIKTSSYPDNLFGINPFTVVDIANSNNDTNRFRLICANGELLHFQLDDKTIFRSKSMVADMQWHHVAFVYDSAAYKQYAIYVDGSLDTSQRGPALKLNNQNIFRLGADLANNYRLEGALDEFRLFDHVRSDSAIKADMNREYCNVKGMGLLAYYKFNDGIPLADNRNLSILYDFSGNGNHLNYSGFTMRGSCWGGCSNFLNGPSLSGGNTRDTITLFDCDTVKAPSGKKFWTSSGKYFDTLTNKAGCDSIVMVNVKIGSSISLMMWIVCDSFKSPLGKIIKRDTSIYEIYPAYTGCDSTVYYNITVKHSVINVIKTESCDSFVSGKGKVYFNTGVYDEKYKSWNGCDSTVRYQLKINRSVNTFEYLEACDVGDIRGESFSQSAVKSFNYKTWKGCDSVHYVFLTVNKSTNTSVKASACDSFISPQGKVYRISGNFAETLKTHKHCDSTVLYKVTINKSQHGQANLSVCRGISINGKWYGSSGQVTYFGKTSTGCDSVVDMQLTVKQTDRAVTKTGNALKAAQDNATYQWISCGNGQAIPFQSGQTFTPQFDGDYAVVILYDGCKDTSDCISFRKSGLNSDLMTLKAVVQPNPSEGRFEVKFEQEMTGAVQIVDMTGKVVYELQADGDTIRVDAVLAPGIYVLRIQGFELRTLIVIK